MFRDSKQRVLSGYHQNFHDCPPLQKRFGLNNDSPASARRYLRRTAEKQAPLKREYAQCVGSCSLNMLTGKECSAPLGPQDQAPATPAIQSRKHQKTASEGGTKSVCGTSFGLVEW